MLKKSDSKKKQDKEAKREAKEAKKEAKREAKESKKHERARSGSAAPRLIHEHHVNKHPDTIVFARNRNDGNPFTDYADVPETQVLPSTLGRLVPDSVDWTYIRGKVSKTIEEAKSAETSAIDKKKKRRLSSSSGKVPLKGVTLPPPSIVADAPRNSANVPPPGSINPVGFGTPPITPRRGYESGAESSNDERTIRGSIKKRTVDTQRMHAIEAQNIEMLKRIEALTSQQRELDTYIKDNEKHQAQRNELNFIYLTRMFNALNDAGAIEKLPIYEQRKLRISPSTRENKPADEQALITSAELPLLETSPSWWELCCACFSVQNSDDNDVADGAGDTRL